MKNTNERYIYVNELFLYKINKILVIGADTSY
jgi:hypothetical protein